MDDTFLVNKISLNFLEFTVFVRYLVKSIPNLFNKLFNKLLANSFYVMFLEYDFILYNLSI